MVPKFRFTIFNTALYPSGIVVETPIGWDEALVGPELDKKLYSLVETFEGSFIWYGVGRQVILAIEANQGPDAIARLLIEIAFSGPFEYLMEQLLDISAHEDIGFHNKRYESDVPIIRDDFYAKVINRFDMPTDVRSTIDKDGNAIAPAAPFVLNLPGQKIRRTYSAQSQSFNAGIRFESPNYLPIGDYVPLDIFSNVTLNEIKTILSTGTDNTPLLPAPTFRALYDGDYTFTVQVSLGIGPTFFPSDGAWVYIQRNDDAPILFDRTYTGSSGLLSIFRFNKTHLFNLLAGDEIRLYIYNISVPSTDDVVTIQSNDNTLDIVANTKFYNTTTKALLIYETFKAVIDRITGKANSFYSEYFGRTDLGYDTTGCGAANALMLGKHLRGFDFTSKPFVVSLSDLWSGANPIFNLGLGYDSISGNKVIRIEPKEYFFSDDVSIQFSNVRNLKRRWDLEKLFKSFENGFQNYAVDSEGGIDDPQTVVRHNSRMATVGTDFSELSSWFAASLGIEQTRRQIGLDNTKDWVLDDTTVIIALNKTTLLTPELDENFDAVTHLLNAPTRYNIRHGAKRIFKRWQNFFAGCLRVGARKDFYYNDHPGNADMVSTLKASDCEGDGIALSEKQNVVNSGPHLFTSGIYEFSTPMTHVQYQAIINDRRKAIEISENESGFIKCSIISFRWQPTKGKVEGFLVWIK